MAAAMDTDTTHNSLLLSLPIELRHKIYGFASQTDHGARRQLRTWYEKKDRAAQIADGWVPPTDPQPVHSSGHQIDEPIEDDEQGSNEDGGPQIGINDEEEEDDESESEDEGQEEDESSDDDSDNEAQEEMDEDQEEEAEEHDEAEADQDEEVDIEDNEAAEIAAAALGPEGLQAFSNVQEQEEDEEEDVEEDVAEDAEEDMEEDVEQAEDVEANAAEDTTAHTVTGVIPTRPTAQPKWRHVTRLLQVSHCAPPLALLQTCKQICEEALAYHYDKAILTFNATRSMEHQTFIEEEVIDRIAEAAYSPLENLRKACVIIVWDTMWINSKGGDIEEPIWKFQLLNRVRSATKLLQQMPQLQKVVIKYYDSDDSGEAQVTRCDVTEILSDFQLNKPSVEIDLQIKIEENGTRVSSRSVMGKQRMQFKRILEGGQNFH